MTPSLRFPKFKNSSKWKSVALGEITSKVSTKNKDGIKYPIYSINNKEGFLPQSEQFDGMDSNERGYDITMYKIIEKNTFAYNPARINVGSIGYSGELNNIIISSLYVCFKTTDVVYDPFLLFYLKSNGFIEEIRKKVEGGIRSYLFYENLSEMRIFLPDKKEQKEIADTLYSLDTLIMLQNEKIKLLENHKMGLLQGLFSEMTK